MPLETGDYISDLVETNPPGTDERSTADDHLRLIKHILKTTFPNLNGAVNPTPAELNTLVGASTAGTVLTTADEGSGGGIDADTVDGQEAAVLAPPGVVQAFAGSTVPTGWLECNGAAINRTTYADLFAVIGTTYGAGDGVTTFNLPDLRGEFIRGYDNGRGADVGRALGSAQSWAIENIVGET
ncbi:MAG: tail fiber protein, partial [Gammaproteobacteria bacterium]